MVKRRELTPHEKACAARARALWLIKKEKDGLSQMAAGHALGISDSAFNQYIKGKIPLNTDMVARLAAFFGVSARDIDPLWLQNGGETLESELLDLLSRADRAELLTGIKEAADRMPPADALKIARLFLDRASAET
jgi:transcriptional regulator with XRE-family HTH domain